MIGGEIGDEIGFDIVAGTGGIGNGIACATGVGFVGACIAVATVVALASA